MSSTFYGNEVSKYGQEHGRVDYLTLSKSFDCVYSGYIMEAHPDGWEVVNGDYYYYEDGDGNCYNQDQRDEKAEELEAERDELDEQITDLESEVDELEETKPKDFYSGLAVVDRQREISKALAEARQRLEDIESELQYLDNELYHEVFQYYIISESGAQILQYHTHELVYYNEDLDLYVWGVTHCGTSWDYVLTEITL